MLTWEIYGGFLTWGYPQIIWLVVSTPLKNISQLDDFSQYMDKIKAMFQTTSQLSH
jgi:hypothetical protein